MSDEKTTVSIEEKKKVADILQKLSDKKSITTEEKNEVVLINEKLWLIKKDSSLSIEDQNAALNFIEMCHKILGRKFSSDWASKEKKGGAKAWIANKGQRIQNCEDLLQHLKTIDVWDGLKPYEQAMILAQAWGSVKQ